MPAIFLSLIGCGFSPIYGTGSSVGEALSDIEVSVPDTRDEYIFVRELESRLGRNLDARTLLNYSISVSELGLNLSDVPRTQVLGRVDYQLISKDSSGIIASGTVDSFTSFSPREALGEAARLEARERLGKILADRLISDLSAKLL